MTRSSNPAFPRERMSEATARRMVTDAIPEDDTHGRASRRLVKRCGKEFRIWRVTEGPSAAAPVWIEMASDAELAAAEAAEVFKPKPDGEISGADF